MSALEQIGVLAIAERAAWVERNTARKAKRAFFNEYRSATGDWFVDEDAEPEDQEKFEALNKAQKAAQKTLSGARGRLRAAIAKALKPLS